MSHSKGRLWLAGVRWAEKENWECNAGLEANGGEHYYDGISVHPMEVMPGNAILCICFLHLHFLKWMAIAMG